MFRNFLSILLVTLYEKTENDEDISVVISFITLQAERNVATTSNAAVNGEITKKINRPNKILSAY